MISMVFMRRSDNPTIDAAAVVATNCSVVHLGTKIRSQCSPRLNVVGSFAMNLLLQA
jgi:hypothetical protein